MENKQVNWEKIGVYIAVTASLMTVIFYLFQIKDEISFLRERTATAETKIAIIEKNMENL